MASRTYPSHVNDPQSTPDTVVTYMSGYPVHEGSKRTLDLFGEAFTPLSYLKGQYVFVFSVRASFSGQRLDNLN